MIIKEVIMSSAKLNEGTKSYKAYQVLSDLQWHCGKCEFPTTHTGGLIRDLVDKGFEIEKKSMYCSKCKEDLVHRRLITHVRRAV
jgi:hypothetical protein